MLCSSAWEQEARVGPLVVLPGVRSNPLPAEALPPVLNNIVKSYGSQWRSGIQVGKNPFQSSLGLQGGWSQRVSIF